MDYIEIPATRMSQKGIPVYSGKIRASDLLEVWAVDDWKENHLTRGYQRERFDAQAGDIADYLANCPIAMIPGVLASMRTGYDFSPIRGDLGIVRLPREKRSLFLMDGQQRTGGFGVILMEFEELQSRKDDLTEDERRKADTLRDLLESYEVPITLVDIQAVTKEIARHAPKDMKIEADQAEATYFFIVNKTQKPVNPSLKDQLAYQIVRAGIDGIPVIERTKWRADAVPVVNALNTGDSPLAQLINLGGARGLRRPVRLNSFVSALERLFRDNEGFKQLDRGEQVAYLKAFWSAVEKLWPRAFAAATRGQFLVLKTIGVYSLNYLANDVFDWCRADGIELPKADDIEPFLRPLREFKDGIDWSRDTSPFAAYGGQKGVRQAYKDLLEHLGGSGVKEAVPAIEKTQRRRGRPRKAA